MASTLAVLIKYPYKGALFQIILDKRLKIMARVTVEDCIEKVTNRFELVMLASQRARKIGSGAALTIDRDNDKNPVVALREIADETIATDDLEEDLIRNNQRVIAMDDDGEDVIDMMDGEQEWGSLSNEDRSEPEEETTKAAADEEPSLADMAGGQSDEN